MLFMLDRAESAYFSRILEEHARIADALDGFVYYPNTVSYGGHTIFGAPPVYGGYEYTPLEMNKRSDTPLVEKNNEALLMLPRLFNETAGYDATVTDLSWANYSWIPDMSITEPYPAIRPLYLERTYSAAWMAEHPDITEPFILSRTLRRNLIYLSVFRCIPPLFREPFYDEGRWWDSGSKGDDVNEFISYYSALYYLPQLTAADAADNQYFTIVNETTHQSCPNVIAKYIGEKNEDMATNVLSLLSIAKWLDALKEMGCYDNTRIIIVADHGSGHADSAPISSTNYTADNLRPLLVFKDFDAHGKVQTDDTFMTNADTPSLLLRGIIDNPANPFTGKPINSKMKEEGVIVTVNKNWTPGKQGRTKFSIQDDQWYKVIDIQKREYEQYVITAHDN